MESIDNNPPIVNNSNPESCAANRKKWFKIALVICVLAALTIASSGIALFCFLGGIAALSFAGISVASLTLPNLCVVASALGALTILITGLVAKWRKTKQADPKEPELEPKVEQKNLQRTIGQITASWQEADHRASALKTFVQRTSAANPGEALSLDQLAIQINAMESSNPLKAMLVDLIRKLDDTKDYGQTQTVVAPFYQALPSELQRKSRPIDPSSREEKVEEDEEESDISPTYKRARNWSPEKKAAYLEARQKLDESLEAISFYDAMVQLDARANTRLKKAQFMLFVAVNEASAMNELAIALDAIIDNYKNPKKKKKAKNPSYIC